MDFNILPETQARIDESLAAYKEANPFRYSEPKKYFSILDTFYKAETIRRRDLLLTVSSDRENVGSVLSFISRRENLINFIVDWCWTYDPRNAGTDVPVNMPWIPWQQQIDFISWFYDRYTSQEPGLIEKSRDAGATWLFCLIYLFEWRWSEGFAAGVGSNKLNSVDHKDNPKSIFSKMRALMNMLPKWWFPVGFDHKKHDKIANLINPENGANISGEGGDDIGRGDRRSTYLVDEAASLEHPENADAALSQTTNCQMDLSTPKGMNNFGSKRHSGRVSVFTFHWKDDPRKDENWHLNESDRLDPVIVAQEIEIDYHASVEGICIPNKWVRAAVDLELDRCGVRTAGLDVAAGGKNKSVYISREGPNVLNVQSWDYDNTTEVAHRAIELGEKEGIGILNYDKIGVGQGVNDTLRSREKQPKFRYFGIGNEEISSDWWDEFSCKAKEIFLNSRAERYYKLKKRFERTYKHVTKQAVYDEQELISIPNDPELIAQLSSPLEFRTEAGKIKIESKDAMRKRSIESPDKADALVYAFCTDTQDLANYLWYGFDYTKKKKEDDQTFKKIAVDWDAVRIGATWQHLGSTYFNETSISHISVLWDGKNHKLMIYDAFVEHNRPPQIVAAKILQSMDKTPVDKFLCQEDVLPRHGEDTVGQLYRRYRVKFRYNPKYDEQGSIFHTNQMFLNGQITVDSSLVEAKRQFSSWKAQDKSVDKSFGLCMSLANLISYLKNRQELDLVKPPKSYSGSGPQGNIINAGNRFDINVNEFMI